MNENKNIQVIKDAYAAFGRGDLAGVLALVADEGFESWGILSDSAKQAPWHMTVRSKAGVTEYFDAVLGTMEPTRFEPRVFAASGDDVLVVLHHEYRVRKTGRMLVMRDNVHHFTVRGGLIVGWSGSEDTAHTAEVLGL